MSAKPMTKKQIINHLAKKSGTTKKTARIFLEELVSLAYKEAKKDFIIPKLGKLSAASRKKRIGRNPSTGEPMMIPAKKFLKFTVSKHAQDAVYPSKK